jgi:hypothetical protein
MHKALLYSTVALGLFGSGAALAQSVPGDAQQQTSPQQQTTGATSAPDHTTPPPPHAQPQAPLADQAKPAAVGPAQANTAAKLGGPADFATPQTMPSTLSAENAALDKLPTTALQLPLTDEQKKVIAGSVAGAQPQNVAGLSDIHVADFLPTAVAPQEFSTDVKQKLPEVGRYKFVKLDKRVLIIDPPNRTVVGVITQ